jgi:hypothetical protein
MRHTSHGFQEFLFYYEKYTPPHDASQPKFVFTTLLLTFTDVAVFPQLA